MDIQRNVANDIKYFLISIIPKVTGTLINQLVVICKFKRLSPETPSVSTLSKKILQICLTLKSHSIWSTKLTTANTACLVVYNNTVNNMIYCRRSFRNNLFLSEIKNMIIQPFFDITVFLIDFWFRKMLQFYFRTRFLEKMFYVFQKVNYHFFLSTNINFRKIRKKKQQHFSVTKAKKYLKKSIEILLTFILMFFFLCFTQCCLSLHYYYDIIIYFFTQKRT